MAATTEKEPETWWEVRHWFEEPHPLQVVKVTQWTITDADGRQRNIGYGMASDYFREHENAVEALRSVKLHVVRDARTLLRKATEAQKAFEKRFPKPA